MRRPTPSLLAAVLVASSVGFPFAVRGADPAATPSAVPQARADPTDRFIVLLHEDRGRGGTASAVERRHGIRAERVFEHAVSGFSARLARAERARLARDPDVAAIVPDELIQLEQVIPNGIRRVGGTLSPAADIDRDDDRVDADVAVVDTGIASHADLNVVGGYDCSTTNRAAWRDVNGHGTHVAGTIAAKDKSGGVVGVAPGARLWAVKILNDSGDGLLSWYICGLDWVAAQRDPANSARPLFEAVNMSVSKSGADDNDCGYTNNDALHRAVCRVYAAGITIVAAAGNQSSAASSRVPAAYYEVITVSALADTDGKPGGVGGNLCHSWGGYDRDDTFADFSNYGGDVDLIAPGKCIWSTLPGARYGYSSGTSMATPHVTGAVALYKASRAWATPLQVRSALQHLGSTNWITSTDPDSTHERLLDVSKLGPWGDFGVSAGAPSAVATEAGGPLTLPVTVSRSSTFFETVSLQATVPSGFSATIDRTSLLGFTATAAKATVTVPRSTRAGTYPITITGRDHGGRVRSAGATITVQNDAPTAAAPTPGLVTGTTLGTTTTPISVTWPAATDPASAIGGYELEASRSGGSWTAVGSYPAATRSAGLSIDTGVAHQVRDRARDILDNWSPWVASPAFQTALTQDTSGVLYTGTWRNVAYANASGGTWTYATASGATARVVVTGREYALVMPIGPTRGSFRVSVDGVRQADVSLYATSSKSRQIVWRGVFPTSAARTIEVRNLGTAGHSRVDLDAVLALR